MKILSSEKRLCTCCMEEHEVKTVLMKEQTVFKNKAINYNALYLYCEFADELYMNEEQMKENDVQLKDAYRRSEGLLTSNEIGEVRSKYGITQNDLCILLGWGGKTITRYESHQVQDRAHDTILKKIDEDPEWFIFLLRNTKNNLSTEVYKKYLVAATSLYREKQDFYLRKTIEASYAKYEEKPLYHGNTALRLDKVVDVIRYFSASKKVSNLYKVKLMKLMWYADALSYKKRGTAITGLIYEAFPMGAVPIAHNSIIDLENVPCEEVDMGEANAYYFHLEEEGNFPTLSYEEKEILEIVIDNLGGLGKNDIVAFMHKEKAYTETAPREIISFEYAKQLQL